DRPQHHGKEGGPRVPAGPAPGPEGGAPAPARLAGAAAIAEVLTQAAADNNERLGRLTPPLVDKLNQQRLFRLLLPAAYGGDEVDLVTWFRSMEAIAKLDASTAWCMGPINGLAASSPPPAPKGARTLC